MIRKLQDLSGIDPNDIPMDDPGSWPSFWDGSARVTAEQIGTPTGMLGIPEFGDQLCSGHGRRDPSDDLRRVTSALWSVSRYRRVVGKCPRLDQGGHCRSIDRYRVSGRHHEFTSCTRGSSLRWPLPSWSACGKRCGSRSQKKSAMATSKP